MLPLNKHIQDSASIADDWIEGRLVIEDGVFIQKEDGELVPVPEDAILQVEVWYTITKEDLAKTTPEGWPFFAGIDARMK